MGAYPEGYLLIITLPQPSDQWFKQFSSGISDFNNDYGTNLIGGDLTKGQLNISVTVFGKKFKNNIKNFQKLFGECNLNLNRIIIKSFVDGVKVIENQNINKLSPEERSQLGIFLAFQYPLEIPGVNTNIFLKTSLNSVRKARSESDD